MHRLEARGHIIRDAWRTDMSAAHAHNSVLGDYPPPQYRTPQRSLLGMNGPRGGLVIEGPSGQDRLHSREIRSVSQTGEWWKARRLDKSIAHEETPIFSLNERKGQQASEKMEVVAVIEAFHRRNSDRSRGASLIGSVLSHLAEPSPIVAITNCQISRLSPDLIPASSQCSLSALPPLARTGVRGYAAVAAANAGKPFKPPVALFGVDGTYASALV